MQTLTPLAVFQANERAIDEGRLIAFAPNQQSGPRCVYVNSQGFKCAIGVAMDDETLDVIMSNSPGGSDYASSEEDMNTSTVDQIEGACLVDLLDRERLLVMQRYHDHVATMTEASRPSRDTYLAMLRAILVTDNPDALRCEF